MYVNEEKRSITIVHNPSNRRLNRTVIVRISLLLSFPSSYNNTVELITSQPRVSCVVGICVHIK